MPKRKVKIPEFKEFQQYAFERIRLYGEDPYLYTDFIRDKYDAWKLAGWKKEKKSKLVDILIWRTTLIQSLIYRVKNKQNNTSQRAEIVKPTSKMKEIENEIIISAYNHYKVMANLELKHDECFNFLLERGIFRKGTQLSEKTKKPWQEWYDTLIPKAKIRALEDAIKNNDPMEQRNKIRAGEHTIIARYVKLEAIKVFFNKFEFETQLHKAIGHLETNN